jgi:hypothetical protein
MKCFRTCDYIDMNFSSFCACVGGGGEHIPEVFLNILDTLCVTYQNICKWSELVRTAHRHEFGGGGKASPIFFLHKNSSFATELKKGN